MRREKVERVALVVGAGGGFGAAISERLAADGVTIALAGRNGDRLEEVAKKLILQGGKAIVVTGDIRKEEDVTRIYNNTCSAVGAPTILVYAAAVPGPFGPIGDFDPQEWWDALTLHLKAPALLIHKALPTMLQFAEGHIVVLSSIIGRVIYPHLSAYGIGKNAQARLIAHAAAERRNTGVSFFAIQPGFAQTDLARETVTSPEFNKWARDSIERIQSHLALVDHDEVLKACGERCAQLVSGKYDALTGSFLRPEDDLDRLLIDYSEKGRVG